MATKPRLFINEELKDDFEFFLLDQPFHYLTNVLRLNVNDIFLAFDNLSGEYECQIAQIEKKRLLAKTLRRTREFATVPDIWLLFAPVKKDKTDFIIEKAAELGARKIIPLITERTISDKVKKERFEAQAVEACEQCRRVDIPVINDAQSLNQLLKSWNGSRTLFFMDETGNGAPIAEIFGQPQYQQHPAAILVGPEGGFSPQELETLRKLPFARGVSMGKRILRAETAAAAALSCWQALAGDWSK